MGKTIKTYIFCFDDHRGFTEEVRKQFPDAARYTIFSYPIREEFINNIAAERESNFCKVAILAVHDTGEHVDIIDKMTLEIKKIDPLTGLILICPIDKIAGIKKTIKFNIDAFIPKNSNSILRIHNTVKMLISEHSIRAFRKRRNFSIYLLLTYLLVSVLLGAIAFFRYPWYF